MNNHLVLHLDFIHYLSFKNNQSKSFPFFYREIIMSWKKHLVWWARYLLGFFFNMCGTMRVYRWIKSLSIFYSFPIKLCFATSWVTMVPLKNGMNLIRKEYNLHKNYYFQWIQLIDSIPERLKFIIPQNYENAIISFHSFITIV